MLAQSSRVQPTMGQGRHPSGWGKHGGGNLCNKSHIVYSQGAERNECWHSLHLFLLVESKTPPHKKMPPKFRVCLLTSMNPV